MKSPLRMFRGLTTLHRNDVREVKNQQQQKHRHPVKLDELVQAAQDMQDMRNYYDSILSAACTTANNAHEFSEALEELGTCLLEKTALNDDEDSGRALMMMGKAQFELQKHFDVYRTHILKTMDKPSRSLIRELENLEKMKCLCDAKREIYKNMLVANRVKEGTRQPKFKTFSSKQLQEALTSYEEEADLFVFRLKSLKKGQFQSLLTQATRHHAAQLSFFKKGLKTLEMVESHVKAVAERHHIDYKFGDLEDNGSDFDDDVDSYYVDNGSDDGELSFDYQKNFPKQNATSTCRNTIEENTEKCLLDTFNFSSRPVYSSKSEPIFADMKLDSAEKVGKSPISTRRFHSYVLPTPADDRIRDASSTTACLETKDSSQPLWHSSPLEGKKSVNNIKESEFPSPTKSPKNPVLKENNIYSGPIRMPSYSPDKPSMPQYNRQTVFDTNMFKRQAFSGPLTSKPFSSKPIFSAAEYRHSMEFPPVASLASQHASKPQSSLPPKAISRNSSPVKISELHELPRPPIDSEKIAGPSSLVGYSGPLVSRNKVSAARSNIPSDVSGTTLPLRPPPLGHNRSFSIPSNSRRISILTVSTLLGTPRNPMTIEEITSPPMTPLPVMTVPPVSTTS